LADCFEAWVERRAELLFGGIGLLGGRLGDAVVGVDVCADVDAVFGVSLALIAVGFRD